MRVDSEKLKKVSVQLYDSLSAIRNETGLSVLRGLEGESAKGYFSVLDEIILNQKDDFFFNEEEY